MANTHLGVPAADLLVLEGILTRDTTRPIPGDVWQMKRIRPEDGAYAPGESMSYTAPAGKAMVITEVDWMYGAGTAGGSASLRLHLHWPMGEVMGPPMRIFEDTVVLGSDGYGGTSKSATTGFLVPPGVLIWPDTPNFSGPGNIMHLLLRGYLVDYTPAAPAKAKNARPAAKKATKVAAPAKKRPAVATKKKK